jgi:hypothetical protein
LNIHKRRRRSTFQWGGCSEDVDFGCKFSEGFVDANEDGNTAKSKLNIHNNEVSTNIKIIKPYKYSYRLEEEC